MAKWVAGQSGNPNGRPRRGRTVAELARTIARERVQFDDGAEQATYSRVERLVRILFTQALDGNLAAARLLIEYMDGKPVEVVQASVEGRVRTLSGDDMAALLGGAVARVGEWRLAARGPVSGLVGAPLGFPAGLLSEGQSVGDEADDDPGAA